LKFSFKRTVLFLIIASALFVNLAIQIARFNSLSTFLRDLRINISLVGYSTSATSVDIKIRLKGASNVVQKRAFVSGVQIFLKSGFSDLGYHRIVGREGMIAKFRGKTFSSVENVKLTGYEVKNFKANFRKMPITYTGYVIVHTFAGGHDLRSVIPIEGTLRKEESQ